MGGRRGNGNERGSRGIGVTHPITGTTFALRADTTALDKALKRVAERLREFQRGNRMTQPIPRDFNDWYHRAVIRAACERYIDDLRKLTQAKDRPRIRVTSDDPDWLEPGERCRLRSFDGESR